MELFAMGDVQQLLRGAYAEFPALRQTHLGVYSGFGTARMSRGINGESQFTKDEEQTLEEVVQAIRTIQESVPYPIDFSQVGVLKPVVDEKRRQLHNSDNPVVRIAYVLRVPGGFFLKVNNSGVVSTTSEIKCAAFEDLEVAEAVEDQLEKLGVKCYVEGLHAFRRKKSVSHNLIEVGFTE